MSASRGVSSLTSTAMRFPLTTTVPLATGKLLARIETSASSDASSSMMAPRPSRRTWWIGMVVVPSTTWISRATLSSVGTWGCSLWARVVQARGGWDGSKSSRYGYEVVNARNELMAALDQAPVEWRISIGLVSYETALAVMDARAAAIAD